MNAPPTRTRFVVLGWLCAAAAIAYVARNASAVSESTIRADLQLSREQSGWLLSAFFFSYALCQIPAAQFAQRTGTRVALPIFALVWSGATMLNAFVGAFEQAIAARVLQGIGQAGLFPAATLIVAKWFPKTGRAFATGSLGSAMSVGGAVCAWLTGIMLESLVSQVPKGWNWRIVFLSFSIPGLIWAVWFWKWFRDDPADHPNVTKEELDHIRGGQPTTPQLPASQSKNPTPWLALCSSPALWWICGQQVFRAAGYMFFTSWFATYLQETRGVGIAKSGFLNMLPLLAVVAGGVVGGALSDALLAKTGSRNIARRWMSMISLLTCAGLTFSTLGIHDALSAVLVISLGSFCSALAAPCGYTITIDMGGSHVATVNATMNMMGNLGAWAFPIMVPWLLARFGSWDGVVLVFGALYIATALSWFLLKPEGTITDQSLVKESFEPELSSTPEAARRIN